MRWRKLRVRNAQGDLVVDRVIRHGELLQLWAPGGEDDSYPSLWHEGEERLLTLIDNNGPVTITLEAWDT